MWELFAPIARAAEAQGPALLRLEARLESAEHGVTRFEEAVEQHDAQRAALHAQVPARLAAARDVVAERDREIAELEQKIAAGEPSISTRAVDHVARF